MAAGDVVSVLPDMLVCCGGLSRCVCSCVMALSLGLIVVPCAGHGVCCGVGVLEWCVLLCYHGSVVCVWCMPLLFVVC